MLVSCVFWFTFQIGGQMSLMVLTNWTNTLTSALSLTKWYMVLVCLVLALDCFFLKKESASDCLWQIYSAKSNGSVSCQVSRTSLKHNCWVKGTQFGLENIKMLWVIVIQFLCLVICTSPPHSFRIVNISCKQHPAHLILWVLSSSTYCKFNPT